MQRTLRPELLDTLPHNHPDALHNRRDLRVTNRIMGTHRWLASTLPAVLRPGERALELGAGTGELGQQLARRGVAVDGLDLWPRPDIWPAGHAWHRANLMEFEGYAPYAAIVGNLIFHQFSDEQLGLLGQRLRRHARVIIACEPARRRVFQVLYRLIGPFFGANYVSRHDGHVSIAAGFRGGELPRALGLGADQWAIQTSSTRFGTYRLVAVRNS